MKQLMLLAVAGLLVFGSAYADGGKRKAGKQQCPASCVKKQCDKKACAQMPGCTPASCNKKS